MGTDIEMYAEVRDGGRWRLAEPLVANEDYGGPGDDPPQPELMPLGLYNDRNRALFAILGQGAGPHYSEGPYHPVAPLRGLPPDVSPEVAAFARSRHDELFGQGWLGLDELLAFDWHGQVIQKVAMVVPDVAHLFEGNPLGFPYSRWPAGEQISYSSWTRPGVSVRWRETYAEAAGSEFLGDVLPYLESFGPPGCVRIVFWFNA